MINTSNTQLSWTGPATTVRIQRARGRTNRWVASPYPWTRQPLPTVTVEAETIEEAARIMALRIEPVWRYPTIRLVAGGRGGIIEQSGRRGVRLFETALGAG